MSHISPIPLKFAISWGVYFSALTLAGCGSGLKDYPATTPLSPSPLPTYQPGDIFVYQNGYSEKVSHVEGDRVFWESYGGKLTYSSHPNFALPRLHWDTEKGHGEAKFTIPIDTLWPLQTGNQKRFFSRLTVTDKLNDYTKPFDQTWNCGVEGARKIKVPAGDFDTWEIRCVRSTFPRNSLMQERRWYYAPDIGHYVLREDMYVPTSNRSLTYRSQGLVAYLPSDSNLDRKQARAAEQHFQHVMETTPSGQSSRWQSEDGQHHRELMIKHSFRGEGERYCRAYQEHRADLATRRQYNGIACRSLDGHWRMALANLENQNPGTKQ